LRPTHLVSLGQSKVCRPPVVPALSLPPCLSLGAFCIHLSRPGFRAFGALSCPVEVLFVQAASEEVVHRVQVRGPFAQQVTGLTGLEGRSPHKGALFFLLATSLLSSQDLHDFTPFIVFITCVRFDGILAVVIVLSLRASCFLSLHGLLPVDPNFSCAFLLSDKEILRFFLRE
jgi:hypothetical protein